MGIFSRLNQVIKSNLNSMIDEAEDPEKLIGQTVVDMEAELKKARRELVTTLGNSKRLAKKAEEHDGEAAKWEEKALLALRTGDEELAREALRFKQKAQKDAENVRRQSREQETAADEMKATLDQIERKIDDLKARKSSLAAQVRRARETSSAPGAAAGGRFGGTAFDELERMTGRIDQLDAEIEAANVLDEPKRVEVDAKFRDLEKRSGSAAVDDELAALKRKLDGG